MSIKWKSIHFFINYMHNHQTFKCNIGCYPLASWALFLCPFFSSLKSSHAFSLPVTSLLPSGIVNLLGFSVRICHHPDYFTFPFHHFRISDVNSCLCFPVSGHSQAIWISVIRHFDLFLSFVGQCRSPAFVNGCSGKAIKICTCLTNFGASLKLISSREV